MTGAAPALVVIAKAPVAGRSKTRLCPPCTPGEAAQLAEAALADTLVATRGSNASRRVLVLEGPPDDWMVDGFEVIEQRCGGLGERLAGAFEDVGGMSLVIGMDTPQVTSALLNRCMARLEERSVDAVLGHALDGGYWAIGLKEPQPGVFEGVPMSTPFAGVVQAQKLSDLRLRWRELPSLRDVDHFEDAIAVAQQRPGSHFSSTLAEVRTGVEARCA